jgi:hypothetical protein
MDDVRIVAPAGWREMDDDKLAWLVIEWIWEWADFYGEYEPFREQMAELTPGQLTVYATTWLDREVCNGGFEQFFENPTGVLGPEALRGFKAIGMYEAAAAVQKAFDFYGMDPYPREHDERQDKLEDFVADEDALEALDDAYLESKRDKTSGKEYDSILERTQAAYIRAHPDEFFRDD